MGSDQTTSTTRLIAVPAGAPDPTPAPRPRSWWHQIAAATAVAGVILGALVGVALATGTPAQAAPDLACNVGAGGVVNRGPEPASPYRPERYEGSRAGRAHWPASDYTLWEVMGSRGLRWTYTPQTPEKGWSAANPEEKMKNDCSLMDAGMAVIGQSAFDANRFAASWVIFLKAKSSDPEPLKQFYSDRDNLLETFRDNIYVPALTVGIIISGYWVLAHFFRNGGNRELYNQILTGALIIIAVSAVLSGTVHQSLSRAVDKYSAQFTSAATNTLVKEPPGAKKTGPCYLPKRPIVKDPKPAAISRKRYDPRQLDHNRGRRTSSCQLYDTLLYQPWQLGQYGTASPVLAKRELTYKDQGEPEDTGMDRCYHEPRRATNSHGYRCNKSERPAKTSVNIGIQQVVSQGYTRYEINKKRSRGLRDEKADLWKGVQYAVSEHHRGLYPQWKGTDPTHRAGVALSSLMVTLIIGGFVAAVALVTFIWHAVLFVSWILLPIAALIALYPPGRRLLKNHLSLMVQAVFLRNLFGLVLALLIGILSVIQAHRGSVALKVFLMIMVAAALWTILSKLAFRPLRHAADTATGALTHVADPTSAARRVTVDHRGYGTAQTLAERLAHRRTDTGYGRGLRFTDLPHAGHSTPRAARQPPAEKRSATGAVLRRTVLRQANTPKATPTNEPNALDAPRTMPPGVRPHWRLALPRPDAGAGSAGGRQATSTTVPTGAGPAPARHTSPHTSPRTDRAPAPPRTPGRPDDAQPPSGATPAPTSAPAGVPRPPRRTPSAPSHRPRPSAEPPTRLHYIDQEDQEHYRP